MTEELNESHQQMIIIIIIRHTFNIFICYLFTDFSHGSFHPEIKIQHYQVPSANQSPVNISHEFSQIVQEGHRYTFQFCTFMHLVKRDYRGFF